MTDDKEDESAPDDGAVLSPDELDITEEEGVVELDEGRFVISPGGNQPNVSPPQPNPPDRNERDEGDRSQTVELSEDAVHEWLERRLESADSKFAFDVTARFEGEVAQRSLFSNDVVTTFENLVVWYATHAGSDTPVEDVLGILLMESNLSIRFPPESIEVYASAHGLDEEDPLSDLFDLVRQGGGVHFPPDDD